MTEEQPKRKWWQRRAAHRAEILTNNVNTNRSVHDIHFSFAKGISGTYILEVTGWNSKEAQENFKFALEQIKEQKL